MIQALFLYHNFGIAYYRWNYLFHSLAEEKRAGVDIIWKYIWRPWRELQVIFIERHTADILPVWIHILRHFLRLQRGKPFRHRELADVLPEHNAGIRVVPQILTNHAEGFLKAAKVLKDLGYEEVNINMGCPSATVVTKGKGAGILSDTAKLRQFLEEHFCFACEMKISVKTRLGMEFPEEFSDILDVLEAFPFHEIIIHPRTREDYYGNTIHTEMFALAAERYKTHPECLCYNGDITDMESYARIQKQFPQISKMMIGRGIIGNPFLPEELVAKKNCFDAGRLLAFHDELFAGYIEAGLGTGNALFKMKELWSYLDRLFPEAEPEKRR